MQADLRANSRLHGLIGLLIGYLIVPGFTAIARHRIVQAVSGMGPAGRLLGKLFWLANTKRGVFLAPTCRIGEGLRLPHPTMIVVGDDVVIGSGVTIYQGVTLGRKSGDVGAYPVVGDGATLYAGATVIGGITIGAGAIVAAHAVVRQNVPPGAVVVGIPARIVDAPA